MILPSLRWPWITTPLCLLVALNLFGHYYLACTVSPGFVDDPPRVQGSGLLWAKPRKTARNTALTGVRWSEDLNVTKAEVTKCSKCGQMRPEVCPHIA